MCFKRPRRHRMLYFSHLRGTWLVYTAQTSRSPQPEGHRRRSWGSRDLCDLHGPLSSSVYIPVCTKYRGTLMERKQAELCNFFVPESQRQDSPCLSPQRRSDQRTEVCSVLPFLSLALQGKTATWPQNRTSFPDTLHRNAQTHTLLGSADSHAFSDTHRK